MSQFPGVSSRLALGLPVESQHASHHRTATGRQRHAGAHRGRHCRESIAEMFQLPAAQERQAAARRSLRIGDQQPAVASRPVPVQPAPRALATTTKQHSPRRSPLATTRRIQFDRLGTLEITLQEQPTLRWSHIRPQRRRKPGQTGQSPRGARTAAGNRVQVDQYKSRRAGVGLLDQEVPAVQVAVPESPVVQLRDDLGRLANQLTPFTSTQARFGFPQQVIQRP